MRVALCLKEPLRRGLVELLLTYEATRHWQEWPGNKHAIQGYCPVATGRHAYNGRFSPVDEAGLYNAAIQEWENQGSNIENVVNQ